MKKVSSVEEYIENNLEFSRQLNTLRQLLISTELEEQIKWNAPTYSINGKNVIGLGAFKNHYCLWFFNGVFLKDEANMLVNAQEGKTKALRQMRFESDDDLNSNLILSYIKEAIQNQKLGKEIKATRTKKADITIPTQLQNAFKINSNLKDAYDKLSLSKQKEYCNYINEAKREATKKSRLEKITPMIIDLKGLHDKYKNC
ncbi:MAG TPA: hypothetical protein EYO76_14335 [Flavobacteriaceae bacterium]|nr:hypothetical protein [Flavobacteriaceae bacterium]